MGLYCTTCIPIKVIKIATVVHFFDSQNMYSKQLKYLKKHQWFYNDHMSPSLSAGLAQLAGRLMSAEILPVFSYISEIVFNFQLQLSTFNNNNYKFNLFTACPANNYRVNQGRASR